MMRYTHITWATKYLIIGILAAIVAVLPGAMRSSEAAPLYNMDRFLNEPHPFASPRHRVAPQIAPAPTIIPRTEVAPPPEEQDDLDLDDLGPGDGKIADVNDPIEPFNRVMFKFNEVLAKFLLGPIARGYNTVMPEEVRGAISNFLDNLNGPVVLANDMLQGEFSRGYDTTMRMLINSTAGILGFIDVAEKLGFKEHGEDFGQTMGVWGIGEGPYLVLPIFGPSNPRDALGKLLVDPFFDPLGYYLDNTDREEIGYALTGARGLTGYATIVDQIDDLRENSLDFYGALRSLYRQRRQTQINNGGFDELPNIDPGFEKRAFPPSPPRP